MLITRRRSCTWQAVVPTVPLIVVAVKAPVDASQQLEPVAAAETDLSMKIPHQIW